MDDHADQPYRQFLTVERVAEILSVGLDDVEALVGTGELPAIRVGSPGFWRIEVSVLDAYIAGRYEEARRAAVFDGFDFGSVSEIDPPSR
ncbi:excisionase family DNA binding protein [Frondihabitans sp. PhB188]|uniref:helix-turn-helix domain-containing protein n=1 Tax=Frondihabitans sp. PhB188 TaxID=2485200 RepID=UPI000F4A661E|nr:helix-turn-helix domain-containing protein [Frondihabitans sp. PhB188]ROQ36604.1 excisionase family DNA binding protein [Frondihabitans sp. PhB188]